MKASDILLMCARNLNRSKSRTFLTVIGVVVGTCAIVVMISLGIGLQASTDAALAEMGDLTVIEVYNWGGANVNTGEKLVMDDATLADIKNQPHVLVATPFYQPYELNMQLLGGRNDRYRMWAYNIVGVNADALEYLGYELAEGNYSLSADGKRNTVAMVVGEYASYSFQDTKKRGTNNMVNPYPDAQGNIKDPYINLMTDTVKLIIENNDVSKPPLTYEIVVNGRLVEDWAKGYQTSRGIFLDIAEVHKIVEAYRKANKIKTTEDQQNAGYEEAKVKVSDIKYVDEVETYIKGLGFDTYSMESTRKPLQDQARQQQVILGCLGAISLVVAAIGIANTMFMSILERTREIGIMKVVGCFVRDIRVAFLIEASAIGLMGGTVGVALSFLISWLMNTFGFSFTSTNNYYYSEPAATNVSIIPWWLVLLALVFSTIIGLISGYFPANRAVKIEALEAIKHE